MSKLIADNLNTNKIQVIKNIDVNKVISRLMDGTDHIQIVGTPTVRMEVQIVATTDEKNALDDVDRIGGLVTVTDNDGYECSGRITEKGEWSRFSKDMYETDLVVSEVV